MTLSPFIKINGVHPDLVLILIIGWIILRGLGEGVLWALIGGLCLDFASGAPFGIFALTHLISSFQIRMNANTVPLAMTILYAISVSLYTVINFSLWADLSTPETIGLNAALGVSLSGWTATFLSTALSIWMSGVGISLERHLNITDAIAMLFFLGLILTGLFSHRRLEG